MAVRTAPPRSPKVPEIRKGDTVVVLAGKDAGKRGTVEQVIRRQAAPSSARSVFRRGSSAGGVSVVVEGLNIAKRHTKPRQSAGTTAGGVSVVVEGLNIAKRHTKARQTSSSTDRMPKIQQGGILDIAQPIPVSKVMLISTKCGKPTRIAHATLDTGRRVRVCRHCGEQLEVKS